MTQEIMVRRLKEDLRGVVGGFPDRKVQAVTIAEDTWPELKLSALLQQYKEAKEARVKNANSKAGKSAGLVLVGLQQRLLSSPEAFFKTLKTHKNAFEKNTPSSKRFHEENYLTLKNGIDQDSDLADMDESELESVESSLVEELTQFSNEETSASLLEKENSLLNEMYYLAEKNRYKTDGKMNHLLKWIKDNQCPNNKWNDLRVIIFTEYEDTKNYIKNQLQHAFEGQHDFEERVAVFHGPTSMEKREEIKRAFNEHPSKNKLRILITTDAAREGLNLQTHCWNLFHYDIPWNPGRLEQRNGRIDRKLQPNKEVFCRYFEYAYRQEDKVLSTLIRKTQTIRDELGSLSQVLEPQLTAILEQGIDLRNTAETASKINNASINEFRRKNIEDQLEAARDKRKEDVTKKIKLMTDLLKKSQKWISMEDDYLKSALNCSLKLSGLPTLQQSAHGLLFPAINDKLKDSTWQGTLDTLRPPKKRDQKPAEWRAETEYRPIVFQDQENIADEKVHLHLEHRLVKRLLNKFSAQGFVQDGLNRVCLIPSDVKTPRAVLLTRLLFFSKNGAGRLHEEIIPISGRWTKKDRSSGMEPFAEDGKGEKKSLELLQKALLQEKFTKLEEKIVKSHIQEDFDTLSSNIKDKLIDRVKEVAHALEKRSEIEAESLKKLLEDQLKRIEKTLADPDEFTQLAFNFEELNTREKLQVEADKNALRDKIKRLEQEIKEEPEKVKALYEYHQPRVEKLGLVYLWPEGGV